MLLKTPVEAAFRAVRAALGGGTAITSGDKSCMGIVKYSSEIEVTGRGLSQPVGGEARALYSEIGDVSLDVPCTVDGKRVYPQTPTIDSARACTTFRFTATRPNEGG
jgi:hypothetical protein